MKYFFLIFAFTGFVAFSQTEGQIDSLEKVYESANLNSKIEISDQLFEFYIYKKQEKIRPELKKLIVLSNKQNNKLGLFKAYKNYMVLYNVQSKFDSTLIYGNKCIELIKKLNIPKEYNEVNQNLIWAYSILGDFKKAETLSLSDLEISKKINDWDALSKSYFGLGNTYFYQNKFPEAIKAYQNVDSILMIHDPIQKTLVNNNINIAQLFIIQKEFKKAEKYLKKAEIVANKNKHEYGLASINLYRGCIEKEKKNPKKGIEYLNKAKEFYEKFYSDYDLAEIYYYLGDCYFELHDFKMAAFYHNKSLPLQEKVQNPLGIANSNFTLGRIDFKNNNNEKAVEKFKLALKIYNELEDQNVLEHQGEAYKIVSQIYESKQDFKSAFEYLKKHVSVNDTLIKNRNQTAFKDLETKYQTEKKIQEIELLKAKNEVSEKQKYIYIAIAGLLLISGIFLFLGYRNKIKTAQKLNELNELKSRFFANISHEFRTPLTLIKSPIQQLQKQIVTDEQNKQLHLIDHNANRMLELVDQLLELSKIDSGKLSVILKKGNLQHFFHSVVEPFSFKAKEENQEFIITTENLNVETPFDKDIITKITTNLLDNAFKYNEPGKPITFVAKKENQHLILKVSNYNPQIKEADDKKLFERFYQKDMAISGFGIGLSLVKDLVELYEGTVKTEFNHTQISFIVELPLKKELKHAVLVDHDSAIENKIKPTMDELNSNLELPILLVVDDNASIREVLKDIFNKNFQIIEASNGKEALKMAQKEIPDAIISDVMMPEMDGFEFTQQIKNNELTSFIPVILLTAKTSDESHLKSLHHTADAFLTKPFNHEILKATVFHQIQERRKLQERYSQELILKPTEVSINSVDEKFIAKLATVLEKAITNPDFNAEIFADEMHISRMQLHRKLKSLFGVSATEFIRNERLKVAADLLKNDKLSVSEIAYNVGFNDVGYFSKCFKEMYQQSPSEFQKK
jgi:signal transduction histidine kinase/CheY-like chemotaxis protein